MSPLSSTSPKSPTPIPDLKKLNAVVKHDETNKKVEAVFIWHNHKITLTANYAKALPEEVVVQNLNKIANKAFFLSLQENLNKKQTKYDIKSEEAAIHVQIQEYEKPKELGKLPGFKTFLDTHNIQTKISAERLGNLYEEHPQLFEDFHTFLHWMNAGENLDPFPIIYSVLRELNKIDETSDLPTKKKFLKKAKSEFKRFWEKTRNTLNYSSAVKAEFDKFNKEENPFAQIKVVKEMLTMLLNDIATNVESLIQAYRHSLDYRIQENLGIIKKEDVKKA